MRGRLGLVLLAVGAVPALIKSSKNMSRYFGEHLIRAGEYLKEGTEETPEPPKADVNTEETTKVGQGTEEIALDTVTPAAQEEVEAQIAAEAMGDGAAVEPLQGGPQEEHKTLEPDQPQNPKRTENSRED